MPERHGFKVDGGWAGGTEQVNGTSVPQYLTIDSRNNNNTPPEYKASKEIDFVDEFASGSGDEFVAYIADGSNTTAGNTGGSGGEFNTYRYGFNGKENDNEVKGEGNQQDYGMRISDGRLGRFLSVDPLQGKYPELTPYQFASNQPIWAIDLDGLERFIVINTIGPRGTISNQIVIGIRDRETRELQDLNLMRINNGQDKGGTKLTDQDVVVYTINSRQPTQNNLQFYDHLHEVPKGPERRFRRPVRAEINNAEGKPVNNDASISFAKAGLPAEIRTGNEFNNKQHEEVNTTTNFVRVGRKIPVFSGTLPIVLGTTNMITPSIANGSIAFDGYKYPNELTVGGLRNLMQGNPGTANVTGNLIFPVGTSQEVMNNASNTFRSNLLSLFRRAGIQNANINVTTSSGRMGTGTTNNINVSVSTSQEQAVRTDSRNRTTQSF